MNHLGEINMYTATEHTKYTLLKSTLLFLYIIICTDIQEMQHHIHIHTFKRANIAYSALKLLSRILKQTKHQKAKLSFPP